MIPRTMPQFLLLLFVSETSNIIKKPNRGSNYNYPLLVIPTIIVLIVPLINKLLDIYLFPVTLATTAVPEAVTINILPPCPNT